MRTVLSKSKRLINIIKKYNETKNLDEVISNTKPPIFWKDKPVIKKQLELWSYKKMSNLIRKLNHIEITIKKNNTLSIILMKNFIYEMLD